MQFVVGLEILRFFHVRVVALLESCVETILAPQDKKMTTENDTNNWPELAIGLYDKLTGRDAEISYAFDEFELFIPSSTANDASHARWKMNGVVRVSTNNASATSK